MVRCGRVRAGTRRHSIHPEILRYLRADRSWSGKTHYPRHTGSKVPTVNVNNTVCKGEQMKKGEGNFGKFNPSRGEALNPRGKLKIQPGTIQG